MKILYIATSFPEPSKGATIYTDLAEELYKSGHQITVVVSEQTRNKRETQFVEERGFEVLRVVTGNYYDVGLIEKGITTLRMPRKMKQIISRYLSQHEFDVVLYEAPPVTNGDLVNWAKKKFNCPSYLMLKDIFPQNAVDIGIISKWNPLYYYFKYKEQQLYKSASIIGCMSEANRKYILKHNPKLNSDKVKIFPNTKTVTANYKFEEFHYRNKYGIPLDACVFIFGGNMGKPQYVSLLSKALIELQDEKDIYFLFIGRGTERHHLEETICEHNIKNAQVLGNLPRDEFDQLNKESDVGLIILDPRFTIPNFPSRILSYMEYAKPILAATDKASDIKELILTANCGEWVWSGDSFAFVETLKKMANSNQLNRLGTNGRNYIEKYLNVKKSVDILEKHLAERKN